MFDKLLRVPFNIIGVSEMGVFAYQGGYAALLHQVVGKECFIGWVEIGDLMQKVLMGGKKVTHGDLGLIVWLDDIRVFRDLRETHREGLAHRPDLLHRDRNLLGDSIIGDIGVFS